MILILLPLISFLHVSFCNGWPTSTETQTTTIRPDEAVITTGGDVLGHNLTFPEGNVTEYLGIPFAYPPYGAGRFLPPTPIDKQAWNGTWHCTTKANSCMQLLINDTFDGYNYSNPRKNISEDCLQLNMWVPVKNNGTTVVFLFGDSFLYGSPSLDLNNGSELALKSGAIIVNLNYRLTIFGFAYLGEDSMVKGNMGLLDQQVGLKWVHDNIENFGGNKSMITLYGSSAGATSVTAHLFSENSKDLFNKAIVASGAITNIWQTNTPDMAYNFTLDVARMLNCTNGTRGSHGENVIKEIFKKMGRNESTEDEKTKILVCLQNKTTDEIIRVVYGLYEESNRDGEIGNRGENEVTYEISGPPAFPFIPIDNDTVFFNGSLWDKYSNKTINSNVDIIFGRTQDEATYIMPFTLQHLGCEFNSELQQKANEQGKKHNKGNNCLLGSTSLNEVANMTAEVMGFPSDFVEKLEKIYNETKNKPMNETKKPRAQVARLMTDFFIHCRLGEFAEYYYNATNGTDKKNVYFYEYRKRSAINPWPKWMGAMHAWELEPIFGYPFRHPELYNKTTVETHTEVGTRSKRNMEESEEMEETAEKKQTMTNLTFEEHFSDIAMKTVGNFSKDGKLDEPWLKYNDTDKKGLVISGNLSEVKYINPLSTKCKKLIALIDEYNKKLKEEAKKVEEKA